jgi:hypothetical protein
MGTPRETPDESSYVRFTGGRLQITPEATAVLTDLAKECEKREKK